MLSISIQLNSLMNLSLIWLTVKCQRVQYKQNYSKYAMQNIDLSQEVILLIAQSLSLSIGGKIEEALDCLDKVRLLRPDFFPILLDKGKLLMQLSRFEEAAASFDELLKYRPTLAEVKHLRIEALNLALTDLQGIVQTKLNQDSAFYFKQGSILLQLGRIEEAISNLNQCLVLDKMHESALNLLGNTLTEAGELHMALAIYEQLLLISPRNPVAIFNRANVLQKLHQYQDAIKEYQLAIEIHPDFAEAWIEQSHCRLALGDFETGWQQFEWRWKTAQLKPFRLNSPAPLWLGQFPLHDKTILLWAEQGFGDTIQFSRFVSMVSKTAKQVILRLPTPLTSLMHTLDGNIQIIDEENVVPEHDTQSPLLSLALVFKINQTNIPADVPYISADDTDIKKWQKKLKSFKKFKVGIVWAGRQYGLINHTRDIALSDFHGLTELNIDLIGLQKEIPQADKQSLSSFPKSITIGERLEDFNDTAGLITNLDLVISVDSAVAHLAGAMGKPTWLLLRNQGEWRWLENHSESPWYPKHRIFRQKTANHWADLIQEVVQQLRKKLDTNRLN